jgi:hypothetical protein
VIAFDTNILVYAHRASMPWHDRAIGCVEAALTGPTEIGLCWPVLHEFLAVVTNPRIFGDPTTTDEAFDQITHWLSSPRSRLLGESSGHLDTLHALLIGGRVTSGAIHDARIAALCLDHGVSELLTADRDFTRFPTLRVRNPLIAA